MQLVPAIVDHDQAIPIINSLMQVRVHSEARPSRKPHGQAVHWRPQSPSPENGIRRAERNRLGHACEGALMSVRPRRQMSTDGRLLQR